MIYDIYFVGNDKAVTMDLPFTLEQVRDHMSSDGVHAFENKVIHWKHIVIVEEKKVECKKCG